MMRQEVCCGTKYSIHIVIESLCEEFEQGWELLEHQPLKDGFRIHVEHTFVPVFWGKDRTLEGKTMVRADSFQCILRRVKTEQK